MKKMRNIENKVDWEKIKKREEEKWLDKGLNALFIRNKL